MKGLSYLVAGIIAVGVSYKIAESIFESDTFTAIVFVVMLGFAIAYVLA